VTLPDHQGMFKGEKDGQMGFNDGKVSQEEEE
jgi:hypothetical protein